MNFSGFLVLLNPLKDDTPKILEELLQAEYNLKVISGF